MRQIPLAIGPEPALTFDNFLPGRNAAAATHLRTLADSGGTAPPPVYLWGPAGSGKTHLLHAAVAQAHADGRRAARFGADVAAPWQAPEGCDRYAIDDCESLDDAQQAAAFSLFVAAAGSGAAVIAAGGVPPVDLPVREDLRTRLGWGHVYALEPLSETGVRSALRREADRRGAFLSDEVMDYLLSRFARDLKHLMALLDSLDAYSLATQRPITVPLLKQMLGEANE